MKSLLRRQVVGRARDRAAKRAWLAQAEANSDAPFRVALAADGNMGGEKGFPTRNFPPTTPTIRGLWLNQSCGRLTVSPSTIPDWLGR